jgi:hypothetical protein
MPCRSHRLLVVILCGAVCGAVTAVSRQPSIGYVLTEDHNGDGRPDVWRHYDPQHRLAEVSVDTNFDGRSDVHEYYERGVLVRRESDRDFNDRVDLIEEFDVTTREHVRSVVDVDYDGTADLLVLFQGGHAVFTKWTHLVTAGATKSHETAHADASSRTAADQLTPLDDPFRADLAMRPVRAAVGAGDYIGLSTSGGLPAASLDVAGSRVSSSVASIFGDSHLSSASVLPYSPRGPPASFLPV